MSSPADRILIDRYAYEMYLEAGENAAQAAKDAGIPTRTMQDRVARHKRRMAQDAAAEATEAEAPALDEAPAAVQSDPEPQPEPEVIEQSTPTEPKPAPALAGPRNVRGTPTTNPAAVKPAKRQPRGQAPENFPKGLVTPVQFFHHLVAEGVARPGETTQRIYSMLKSSTFPATWVDDNGETYDHQVTGTRPAVRLTVGVTWYAAKYPRNS